MKKRLLSLILITTALLLMACGENATQNSPGNAKETQEPEEQDNVADNDSKNKKEDDQSESTSDSEEGQTEESQEQSDDTEKESSSNSSNLSEENALSKYTSEEIEYARVWLEVIDNKDVEELNVYPISAGEQVNPYDDNSVDYPEDVITLGGKIMADGIVTYSGNGDGTINLYDVPSHWPSYKQIEESMEEYTENIIKNTSQIYIEPGNDEDVIDLIEKLDIQR